MPRHLDELPTEAGGEASLAYDLRSTRELVELMNSEDRVVPEAVAAVHDELAVAIDAVVERLRQGGRLVYVGAGSSGRIAAVDAAECESTFSTPRGLVVAVVAGGSHAPPLEQEAAEDDLEAGRTAMIRLGKTFGNLMVDVNATNEKLRARVLRIVETATGVTGDRAEAALASAGGNTKVAIVSLLAGVDADEARARLASADGSIRQALSSGGAA
jgi:N-acetylmuramic acid 6-phosphate (MurNAc-6-P) etherase